jgi:hypothetical protein
MDKIDILLNAIACQHLRVEVVLPVEVSSLEYRSSYNRRLYDALFCAFTNGVQYATSHSKKPSGLLLKEVDIDVSEVDWETRPNNHARPAGAQQRSRKRPDWSEAR